MATFKLNVSDALNSFTGETLTSTGTTVDTHFNVVVSAKSSNDFFIKTIDSSGSAVTGVTITIDGSGAGTTDTGGYLHLNKATGVFSVVATKANYDTISQSIPHTNGEITGTYMKMYPFTFNRIVVKPSENKLIKVYEGQTGEDTVVTINRSEMGTTSLTMADGSTGKTQQNLFDDMVAAFSGENGTNKIVYKPSTETTTRIHTVSNVRQYSADTRSA